MSSIIINNFEMYFPREAKRVDEYIVLQNRHELFVKLKDGSNVLFDDLDKTIRYLPVDSMNMTEEQCQREFGLRLYKIMLHKGVTQSELSEKTGIPQAMISGYITGKHTPSFYKVDKIAKALNCSLDDFRYIEL